MENHAEDVKVIVFQLQNEEYGVPVGRVGSIERMMPITRVPRTVSFVKGVMNLRGVVTPIIDLRERFGIEGTSYDESTRIIIVHLDDMEVGLVVDSANDVIDIPSGTIEPPPEVVGTVDADYISGVAKLDRRLLILLNLEEVLSEQEIRQLQSIEG
ncbi:MULTISPECIES: chemotaxis protein CheW [Pontibacillus]|uniref:Chemotaxis protein CheW n=1 Tax=Pontibacillus chungwhensis TaxID=265426 RepID=A0ABY8V1Y7_9BACI|nr:MULTISPECIES: chemotaxis protein CheW [Pontibacillus]MCD5322705.1 chemotaxis protein CheW [Pontibacillus sp. HN14]WIF99981.1 chemotaxis protein CheW [Pontibacillus chungwhensis]